ncbi:MAG: signal peptidase II [Clostridia bacterium]|jgi:signal peptidase II|nr:signal peptidase II [Clostridia bacterium]MCI2001026.1 signal peptidase II [Clostridia bacterium]MCI2015625.1 signal peptidase II [Clostridia bacterium]
MIFIISAIVLALIDQISKFYVLANLKPVGSVQFLPGILDFTFVENQGAAFGILSGGRWIFVFITLGVTIAAFWYVKNKMPKKKQYLPVMISLVLILAGAWGNVIDRLFRGYVVDFFEFKFISWPVFNLADIYVVTGTVLLAVMFIFVIKDDI